LRKPLHQRSPVGLLAVFAHPAVKFGQGIALVKAFMIAKVLG